jgi:hypothetical protein
LLFLHRACFNTQGFSKGSGLFEALLEYFRQRQLNTPRQQKNYVVDVRKNKKAAGNLLDGRKWLEMPG